MNDMAEIAKRIYETSEGQILFISDFSDINDNEKVVSRALYQFTGQLLGESCANFAAFSSPEAFIFFGGLTKAGDLLMNPIKKAYDDNVLNIYKGKAKFLVSSLEGSSAAVLGASAVGWDIND